jgi:hypothetical protein
MDIHFLFFDCDCEFFPNPDMDKYILNKNSPEKAPGNVKLRLHCMN